MTVKYDWSITLEFVYQFTLFTLSCSHDTYFNLDDACTASLMLLRVTFCHLYVPVFVSAGKPAFQEDGRRDCHRLCQDEGQQGKLQPVGP